MIGKPAPLIVHPTNDPMEVTLLGELHKRWPKGHFHFINRLDRETSGCVLIAKSRGVARIFGKQMMRRQIRKGYWAIVHGWPEWDRVRSEAPILRMGEVTESAIWIRQMVHEDGKVCATDFEVVERFEKGAERFAVLDCNPETGRTHQLRVHLAHLGHAIVGDKIYCDGGRGYLEFLEQGWTEALEKRLLLSRQALHGSRISFEWEEKFRAFECEWPEDLANFNLGLRRSAELE